MGSITLMVMPMARATIAPKLMVEVMAISFVIAMVMTRGTITFRLMARASVTVRICCATSIWLLVCDYESAKGCCMLQR